MTRRFGAKVGIVLFSLAMYSCGSSSQSGGETTNPNVSILLKRGSIQLFAARDYIHFPDVAADGVGGTRSPALSFSVTNTGTETMKIYRVESSSGDQSDFLINTSGLSETLAPAGSTAFSLSFDPLTAGRKEATIVVVSNAGTDHRYEIKVTGTALPLRINAKDTATHAFAVKTRGDLTTASRCVIPGNIRPTGGLRVIVGNQQSPGANQGARMTVFKKIESGGLWDLEKESEKLFSTGAYDLFEPILAYDFDNNGVEEIFANLNFFPAFLRWNGNDFEQCWTEQSALITGEYGVAVADVNRDGRSELLTGDHSTTFVYAWDAGFANFHRDASLVGGSPLNVGVGDLDGDGFLEVATTVTGSNGIYVYRFNGTSYEELYSGQGDSAIGYSGFAAVDLDGDYVDELVAGSPNRTAASYDLSLFEWNGSALSESILVTRPLAMFQIATGDFDRDGQAEALVAENGFGTWIVEHTATGIQALAGEVSCDIFMTARDYDGDGFPELFVTDCGTTASGLIVKDDVINP